MTTAFDILALLIPIVLAICIVAVIGIIEESRLFRRLAETEASDELVRALMRSRSRGRRSAALKWGLVLVALGLGFALVHGFGFGADDPASFALLFSAGGLGLLAFRAFAPGDD